MKKVITKEQIEELYLNQDRTSHECQNLLGISRLTWKRLVKEYAIKKQIVHRKRDISAEQIKELYYNQDKTSHECQDLLNISRGHWKRLVKEYGIKKTKVEIIRKIQDTTFKKYGVTCSLNNKDIRKKAIDTCMKNYGVAYAFASDVVRKKAEKTLEKLYGAKNISQSSRWKKVMTEHFNAGIPQQKAYQTRKKNRTFGYSQPEKDIYNLLVEKFGVEDVEKQYKSELYPFLCDFYIKSIDTYIEYQGTWQHGRKPYNPNDPSCIKRLNKWQRKYDATGRHSYSSAIERYTVKDPLKRKTAKDNNLNWFEFFSMEDFYEWFNQF